MSRTNEARGLRPVNGLEKLNVGFADFAALGSAKINGSFLSQHARKRRN
jgi:hypothetical protein